MVQLIGTTSYGTTQWYYKQWYNAVILRAMEQHNGSANCGRIIENDEGLKTKKLF